ncbi:MAG: GAF domain-containing protein, partial [Polyangiaceae bacterium]
MGALWLLNTDGSLALACHWGATPDLVARFGRIEAGSRLPPQVAVRSGIAQWIESAEDYVRYAPAIAQRAAAAGRFESFAAIPIKMGPRVLGVFDVSYHGWRKFSPDERALFATMAEHSGQALERALLHEALERRAVCDRFLAALSLAIAPAISSLPAMVEAAVRLCGDALKATCVLLQIAPDAQTLDPAAIFSPDPQTLEGARAALAARPRRVDEGLSGRAIRERKLVTAQQATTDRSVARELQELAAGTHVSAAMCAPLVSRGVVIGTIMCLRQAPSDVFDAEDMALLSEAGTRLAIAIDRIRLLEAAQRSARQADEASRMKDEFLATVSHELRTPLNAILGWSTLLLREGVTTDRERKGLDVIHRNAQTQARLIDDILDVSRIIMGKLRIEPRPVDLIAIAEQAIDVVAASAAAKRVELSFAPMGPFPVMADPSRVQQV